MDLASDSSLDNDLQLPSTVYESDTFSELFGGEMPQLQHTHVWTLDEIGYTYDAPHVYPDGRMEGALHSPEYYAYGPHTGNWEDGLQAIESFDWVGEKISKQHGLAREEEGQDLDVFQTSAALDDGQVCDLEERSITKLVEDQLQPLCADTQSRALAQSSNIDQQWTDQASEPNQRDASYIATNSPAWIPSPPKKSIEISPTATSESNAPPLLVSPPNNRQHATASYGVEIDVSPTTTRPNELTVEIDNVPPSPLQQKESLSFEENERQDGANAAKISIDNNMEAEDIIERVSEPEAGVLSSVSCGQPQTASRWHGLMSLEPYQSAISSDHMPKQPTFDTERSHQSTTQLETLFDLHTSTNEPPIYSNHGSLLSDTQHAITNKDQGVESLPKLLTTSNSHPRQDSVAHIHPLPLVQEQVAGNDALLTDTDGFQSVKEGTQESTSALLTGAIPAHAETKSRYPDEQWQEQLQKAAAEMSSDDISKPLSPGHIEYARLLDQVPFKPADKLRAESNSPWLGTALDQHPEVPEKTHPSPSELFVDAQDDDGIPDMEGGDIPVAALEDAQTPVEHIAVSEQSPSVELLTSHESIKETIVDDTNILATVTEPADLTKILETKNEPLATSTTDSRATVEHGQYTPSASTPEATTDDSLKRSKPTKSEDASDIEEDAPARKKRRETKLPKLQEANGAEVFTFAVDDEVEASKTSLKRRVSESLEVVIDEEEFESKEKPPFEQAESTSRLAHFALGIYSRPAQEAVSVNTQNLADEVIFSREAELRQPDNAMELDLAEHYSDVEILLAPAAHDLPDATPTKPKTQRGKNPVSTRELLSLTNTTPREDARTQRAKSRGMSTTPGSHLSLHLNPKEQKSSTKTPETALTVSKSDNSFLLVEEDTPDATLAVETDTPVASVPKKRPSAVIIRKIQGPPPKKMKTAPVKKAAKTKKRPNVLDTKEEDNQELFPVARIEPDEPTNDMTIALAPPKIKATQPKGTTKKSTSTSHDGNVLPSVEQRHPLDLGYGKRHTRGDTKYQESQASSRSNTTATAPGRQFNGRNTRKPTAKQPEALESDVDEDWSHAAIAKAKAKTKANLKTKPNNGPLTLSLRATRATASHAGTPAMSIASTSTTLGANKYGFTPRARRTRNSTTTGTTAGSPTPKPRPAPKPKAAATKGKAKKSEVVTPAAAATDPVDTISVETHKKGKKVAIEQPAGAVDGGGTVVKKMDRRTTRQASAVEEEIRRKEEVEGNVKMRLRGRGGGYGGGEVGVRN